MTDVATNTVDQQLVKKTHPVRGILWGLMMGFGLSIVLVLTKVIPLDLVPMLIVLILGTVVGTIWSLFGPAKHAKDVPATANGVDGPASRMRRGVSSGPGGDRVSEGAIVGGKGAGADVGVEPGAEVGDAGPRVAHTGGRTGGVDPFRGPELADSDQALAPE